MWTISWSGKRKLVCFWGKDFFWSGLRQSFFWSESEANFFLVWVWCKVFFWFGLRQRFFWSDTREVPVQLKLLRWAVSKKERRNNEQGAVPVLTLSSTSWPYNWLTHSLNWETAWLPTLASSLAPKIFSLLFKHLSLFKSSQVATYLSSSWYDRAYLVLPG